MKDSCTESVVPYGASATNESGEQLAAHMHIAGRNIRKQRKILLATDMHAVHMRLFPNAAQFSNSAPDNAQACQETCRKDD